MHLEVDIYPMIASAKEKWGCLEEDERLAANYAFTDAILHIERVAEYRYYSLRLRRGIVHMHWFRIGHAIFEITVFRNYCPIITDIGWLT